MTVHVFGTSPSTAVAIHGLHQSIQVSELHIDSEVQCFVICDFYVDNGLKDAVNMQKKKRMVGLKKKPKAAHNPSKPFPAEDCAKIWTSMQMCCQCQQPWSQLRPID